MNTYSVDFENVAAGDIIRYTNAGSRDEKHAAQQIERVFKYDDTPLSGYTAYNGSLRSISTSGANHPPTKFRMTHGTVGLFNSDKLTINVLSNEANEEIVDFGTLQRFYKCDGKDITAVSRYGVADPFEGYRMLF